MDRETLSFYTAEAASYAAATSAITAPDLLPFISSLPRQAHVLELGCGSGAHAAVMIAHGLDVDVTDGSPAMVTEAAALLRRPVRVLAFGDLMAEQAYDGIWASACLLHVPQMGLEGVLRRVWRALRDGGLFYASFKSGSGEGRDRFGRYYNYPTKAQLTASYQVAARWTSLDIAEQDGGGYDGQPTQWLTVFARR